MYFTIVGTFAQLYREELGENVRMGMAQAARKAGGVNRPKTGYDLINGHLVPSADAPTIRRIFGLRADGASQREIAEATGVNQSTVVGILDSRSYLGEVLLNGEWHPGLHAPILTPAEWAAAHEGRRKGLRRGRPRHREPDRGHSLTIDNGWEQVAQTSLLTHRTLREVASERSRLRDDDQINTVNSD